MYTVDPRLHMLGYCNGAVHHGSLHCGESLICMHFLFPARRTLISPPFTPPILSTALEMEAEYWEFHMLARHPAALPPEALTGLASNCVTTGCSLG